MVVIFDFMPSHRSVLLSLYDLSLALIEELGLGVHSGAVVTVRLTEIGSERLYISSHRLVKASCVRPTQSYFLEIGPSKIGSSMAQRFQ